MNPLLAMGAGSGFSGSSSATGRSGDAVMGGFNFNAGSGIKPTHLLIGGAVALALLLLLKKR